jgi:hypothetical protein
VGPLEIYDKNKKIKNYLLANICEREKGCFVRKSFAAFVWNIRKQIEFVDS